MKFKLVIPLIGLVLVIEISKQTAIGLGVMGLLWSSPTHAAEALMVIQNVVLEV
jgi:hypothetical protein